MKFDLLPISIPSPRCSIEAVSTQTRSPSPTSFISVIVAFCISKLFVPMYSKTSLTCDADDAANMTPSTPTSSIENIFLTSAGFFAIANMRVCNLCSFAIMFSSGIIFQSFTSMMTKSSPFFACCKISSISSFDRT